MMFKTIFTVLKKELTVTLRDSKTLVSAILLPAIVIPLIAVGMTKIEGNISETEKGKNLNIALVNAPSELNNVLVKDKKFTFFKTIKIDAAKEFVVSDSLDAIFAFEPNFSRDISDLKRSNLNLYYKSDNRFTYERISDKIEDIEKFVLANRMQKLNVDSTLLAPVIVNKTDILPPKEKMGELMSSVFPILFIIFCFIGCMYPAIELITGEKEKGTVETLLTVSASRFHILIGKMATIAIIGFLSALLTVAGMMASVFLLATQMEVKPSSSESSLMGEDMFTFTSVSLVLIMLVPLSIFFAGLLAAMVIRTSSFKESQSVVTPMTFVVVAPVILALSPGIQLNWTTACIPILNIALALKEIVAGTINMGHYFAILLSLSIIATLTAYLSYKSFSKESMILN